MDDFVDAQLLFDELFPGWEFAWKAVSGGVLRWAFHEEQLGDS